jgi:hypothetical protein
MNHSDFAFRIGATIVLLVVVAPAIPACSIATNAVSDAAAAVSDAAAVTGAVSDAAPTAVGCNDPDPGVLDFIDNMEDGNALILNRDGRNGAWYTFHDTTTGALNPEMGTAVAMEPIPKGRCTVSKYAMRVGIGDEWSVPQGGHCDIAQTSGSTACYDHFGSSIALTPLWTRYTFQFGELQQRDFGIPRPALSVGSVHFIEFTMPAGAPVFDIWVDDVSFF